MSTAEKFLNIVPIILPLLFLFIFYSLFAKGLKMNSKLFPIAEQKVEEYKNKKFFKPEEKEQARQQLIKELIDIKYKLHFRSANRGKIDLMIALL